MKRENKFVWIDDNPSRKKLAADLQAECGISVDFINVQERDLEEVVDGLMKGAQPGLMIIDHVLDKAENAPKVLTRGSTIAEAMKVEWPGCPVIGITAAEQQQNVDRRTKLAYDELFPSEEFRTYLSSIPPIAADFAKVADASISTASDLVAFLRPPTQSLERLDAVLPDDLKNAPSDRSVPSLLYGWVQRTLVDRPGFLYDDLWSATLIGVNSGGFQRLIDQFDDAVYRGVFALPHRPRWWASRLLDVLYTLTTPSASENPQAVGRRLPGLTAADYSKCYACGGDFPETVAFVDAASEEVHPMHLRCTIKHPRYSRELFFDEIRVMRGDD